MKIRMYMYITKTNYLENSSKSSSIVAALVASTKLTSSSDRFFCNLFKMSSLTCGIAWLLSVKRGVVSSDVSGGTK